MVVGAIGDSNGSGTITMGNCICVAMDDGMAAQSLCAALRLQWMVAAAIGNGGERVAIDNGCNSAMDGGMMAQLQWALVAAMDDSRCHNGRWQHWQQVAMGDNSGSTIDNGTAAQL